MPDYTIANQVKIPDSLATIGNMVNTARGALELKTEMATQPAEIARRKAVSEAAQTGAEASKFKLTGDQSSRAMQIAGALIQDPRISKSDPIGTIDAANEAYSQMVSAGVPKNVADFWASQVKAKAHQPGGALQLLQNVTRANAGSGTQAGVINAPATMVQTPSGSIAPLQLQPGAPGAVQPVSIESLQGGQPAPGGAPVAPNGGPAAPQPGVIPAGVPPSQREQPTTDALGRPAIQVRDQAGNITYKAPPGANHKPLMALPAGETPETAKPLLALRDQAQAAAAQAPAQHFNNRQILELADSAFTGTGSPTLSRIFNAFGVQQTNDIGADTAKLQHFIALQVEQNAAAQGANTDAARQMAASAVLPNASPAQAIKAITKVNDAYATGAELFNRGMQATLKNPDNPKDVFAIRDFQNAWTQNMDPRIFLLDNAVKSGDKDEVARIKKELGDNGIKELRQKAINLQKMIHGGVGGT